MIISFILTTLMLDSWVILKGEIRCWSLSGIRGLREVPLPRVVLKKMNDPLNKIGSWNTWIQFQDLEINHQYIEVL